MTDLPLLRGSERKDFKRCPQRWWWAWRDGLESNKRKLPLWFGTGIHLAFEHWYIPGTERGRDLRETWSEYCEEVRELIRVEMRDSGIPGEPEQVVMDAEGVGLAMLDNYLVTYGHDEQWEILSPERPFGVTIPRSTGIDPERPKDTTPVAKFHGTFDIVARDQATGKIWLWDHKTARSIRTNHLPLDDQAGGYWAVADNVLRRDGTIGKNERISGILYNFLMKAPPDERPVNEQGLATNKPKKSHFVEALLEVEAKKYADDGLSQLWVDEVGPKREAELKKMALAALEEEADELDLVVLGDVSNKQPSPRFHREPVYRTSKERRQQIQRIADEVASMNAMRDGLLPLYKTPTSDCTWDCDFYNLCLADENGGDVEMLKSVAYHVRDPYEAHREERKGDF
ncbi:exonuclease [Gordonia phage Sukkupi]|uniref:Cas4 family exonuclease n=1 Tax=Gordonia phage Sukkupi TaxID=2653747 RepID=A0A5Q2WJ26_9CAUD|nr:exonuclease [Gordonia phage Sukkupi]QGH79310.1 Cas4 family exonuclease [Gordonia phage Sukkupi]QGH80783.1 Cas4 family exonuclease [Gordonia phage Yndexa]